MNNSGQAMLVGLMIFVIVLITAIIFITPLKDLIVEQRDSSHLDCDNSSISFGAKATCIVADLIMPWFIFTAIAAGASYVGYKIFTS
jgi:hypothetical protein